MEWACTLVNGIVLEWALEISLEVLYDVNLIVWEGLISCLQVLTWTCAVVSGGGWQNCSADLKYWSAGTLCRSPGRQSSNDSWSTDSEVIRETKSPLIRSQITSSIRGLTINGITDSLHRKETYQIQRLSVRKQANTNCQLPHQSWRATECPLQTRAFSVAGLYPQKPQQCHSSYKLQMNFDL